MIPNHETPYLLSLSHLNDAVKTLSSAFHEDPLWQFIYPNEQKRQQTLIDFFKATLTSTITRQKVYGVGTPPVGVAIWEFPGQRGLSLSPLVYAPLLKLAFSLSPSASFKARQVYIQFERMRKTYVPGPHYYLQTIGVRPAFQGQGLASQLIRPFLGEANNRGLACYTETVTPANVSFYEHFGFKIVERYALPGTPLTLWGFCRAASRSFQLA